MMETTAPVAIMKQEPARPTANGNDFTATSSTGTHFYALCNKDEMVSKREVDNIFEKKFKYLRPEGAQWQLPPAKELFSEFYQLENLQLLKERLNSVKSKLNDYVIEDWSSHTRRKDPAGEVPWRLKNETHAEFVTVAWCKFFECLHQYPLVKGPKMNSLHLCEAPGAFIAALNHYMYTTYSREEVQWNWLSTTLNPYYEGNPLSKMIADDRFMLYTLDHWLFHDDFTGNMIELSNIESMQRQCGQRLSGEVQLITADGSIDCIEKPDYQEEFVSMLHFAEICTALSILAEGGSFVLKLFTLYESTTISKVYLLNCIFEEVHVFKPATSRRGNSENYLVCLGFRKDQVANFRATLELMKTKLADHNNVLPLFQKSHLPKDFLQQHEICARLFMNLQINAIESNISSFGLNSRMEARHSHILRTLVCKEYFKRYQVQPLPEELSILYSSKGVIAKGTKMVIYKGSYTERKQLQGISTAEKIFMLCSLLNEIEKSLCSPEEILLQEDNVMEKQQVSSKLKLYRGTTFETLHSSLFATGHILSLRDKLQQLFQFDPLWLDEPKCVLERNTATQQTLALDLTHSTHFFEIHRNFMLRILTLVLQNKPQKLFFANYAFLTHFSVSLLRYLALNCFRNFTIATHPQFVITLEHCVYDERTVCLLESLLELLQRDSSVLCVMDILRLHRNKFSTAMKEFNNMLLLKNYKLVLNN